MSEISLEVLNKDEQENLFKLSPFFKDGGYLAGGTALMLQLYFNFLKNYSYRSLYILKTLVIIQLNLPKTLLARMMLSPFLKIR